jgi:adenine-specific DNA-methyltransferase
MNIAISSAGETKENTVGLAETINWLLGLKVKQGRPKASSPSRERSAPAVHASSSGARCPLTLKPTTKTLEKFLGKLAVNPADTEFDFLYVNGPHTLNDPHNKVHLIEETFQRLDTTNFESLS